MFIKYNQNPCDKRTIDCTVRALSTLLDDEWETVYFQLCLLGYSMCDMPSSKAVINEFLHEKGFTRHVIPNTCPYCYSVSDFAGEHFRGRYLLATDSHVVPVIDGNYIDTWDSGDAIPLYYWVKEGDYADS